MKVIRYSNYGFKPQQQTHHMNIYVNFHLYNFNIDDYPEYMRYILLDIHKRKVEFYSKHLEDFKSGVWCFIDGYKSNLALNHLKRKVACYEAELPDDTQCYDCNWDTFTTIKDSLILYGGCYIPERELYKLSNVKRRNGGKTMGDEDITYEDYERNNKNNNDEVNYYLGNGMYAHPETAGDFYFDDEYKNR